MTVSIIILSIFLLIVTCNKSNKINFFSENILNVLILSSKINEFSLNSLPLILKTLKGSVILIFNNLIDLCYSNSTKPKFDPYKKIILFFW